MALGEQRASPGKRGAKRETVAILAQARRVGLRYALRTAPSRRAALGAAAAAIEQRLIGRDTASDQLTVAEMLAAIEQLGERERAAIQAATTNNDGAQRVARLSASSRANLARKLRDLACASNA